MMNHGRRVTRAWLWPGVLALLLLAACGGGSNDATATPEGSATAATTATADGNGTADSAVSPLFDSMVAWSPEVVTEEDTRDLQSGSFQDGDYNYQCTVSEADPLTRTFDEFPAPAFQGTLVPGLFIDGDRLLQGEIQAIPLARAPLELVMSLASENPVVSVEDPSTATLQQAVSTLQRDADSRLSGIDVVPADISYLRKEAYSFEQTALELGFSLRYDGPLASAGLDTAFSSEKSYERHTILVRMVQPMYTISFVDDHVFEPSQLLGSSVTPDQVSAAVNAGRLKENSPAVYIKSVTYGRTMLFTMSSTKVESAQELQVAMNAAYGNIGGNGSVTDEERKVLAESEIRMVALGGDTAAAEAAMRSADPGAFFSGANTANAAPLSFRVATLAGDEATVQDVVNFKQQACDRSLYVAPAQEYAYKFVLSQVQGFATVSLNNGEKLKVESVNQYQFPLGLKITQGSGSITFNPADLPKGTQTVEINFGFPTNLCVDAKVNLKVYVNNVFADEQSFSGCAYNGSWVYTVDKATGALKMK